MSKHCYVCARLTGVGEATEVADRLDALDTQAQLIIGDALGLNHCMGDSSEFLDDGRVVLCETDYINAKTGV